MRPDSPLPEGGTPERASAEVTDPGVEAGELLAFEDLLSELSATFARITSGEVDRQLTHWLERIGLFLEIDRSSIVQLDQTGTLHITHQWAREGVLRNPIGLNVRKVMPWLAGQIANGEVTVVSSTNQVPQQGSEDLEWGRQIGIKSVVLIPFKFGGIVVGAVSFGTVYQERIWSTRMVQRLRLAAEIFGGAIERQRSKAENSRLLAEMRQISSVAMMGELTASLAHELNQPLGAVLNNARAARRLLAAKNPDLKEIGEALDDIVEDNTRAVETIRQLRSLFQRGESQTLPVDIRSAFRDIERIARPDANSKRVDLQIHVPPSVPIVFGDRTQLTQAILNLVTNAIDSVCETNGGPRTVTMRASESEAGHLHVAVCDSGKGIDPVIMPKLFDPFFTTKSKGMGMGLAIVKTIVETHGGHIWAAQNSDRGATLEFALPVASSGERAQ